MLADAFLLFSPVLFLASCIFTLSELKNLFPSPRIKKRESKGLESELCMRKAEKLMTNCTRIDSQHLSPFPSFLPPQPVELYTGQSLFHVNKCSQVGVAMEISPQLPWRRDRGRMERLVSPSFFHPHFDLYQKRSLTS